MARVLVLSGLALAARASLEVGRDPARAAPAVEAMAVADDDAGLRPNLLLAVVDDWGSGDVSYNDPALHTPELERMARAGVVLDAFYAAPTCTPSRAMLMTGRYNIRNGMQDSVIHSTEPRGVPLDERFLSQKLSDAGYHTACVGKWHLGMHRDAYTPLKRGFDLFYGILTGGGSHTGHFSVSQPFTVRGQSETTIWQGYNLWENGRPSDDNFGTTHSTHLYTAKAKEYVAAFEGADFDLSSYFAVDAPAPKKKKEKTKEKKGRRLDDARPPWFVYLSYQAVHDPVTVGDDRYVSQTRCANVTTASEASRADAAISLANRPTLCGMVAEIDDGVKTLRLALGDAQAWAQTVFLVVSDNGGVRAHGSANYPLRGEKAQYYEGGVRVPAVLGGGYVESKLGGTGKRLASLAHVTDVHATFLRLAAYEATAADKPLDGVDLFDHLVLDAPAPRTDVLININSALFAGSGALIAGGFKLMVNPEPNESSVYSKVRKALAAQTGAVATATFQSIIAQAHKDALSAATVHLFDLSKNPYERTDCVTADAAESCDLYANADFASQRADLERRWAAWQQEAAPSSFAWEDDGPLADPALFGNMWAPWRDGDDTPKAHYFGTLGVDGDVEASLASAAAAPGAAQTARLVAVAPQTSSNLVLFVGLAAFVAGAAVARAAPRRRTHVPLP